MNKQEMFGIAEWVSAGSYSTFSEEPDPNKTPHFPILRSHFKLGKIKKAVLRVVGLGWFHCYVNGKVLPGGDLFLPFSTDYEKRNRPVDEIVTGHRLYVPEYDVTDLLKEGENTLAIHFGGGWYCYRDEFYGYPKAIFRLQAETEAGTLEFFSSASDKIGESAVVTGHMPQFEHQDLTLCDPDVFMPEYDDTDWKQAETAEPVETDYLFTECPSDGVCETLKVALLAEKDGVKHYDIGRNTTGWPVLKLSAPLGETIRVTFSEERHEDGTINEKFSYNQHLTIVSNGMEQEVRPAFTWFGARYFKVEGNAVPLCFEVVHARIPVTSDFQSSSETLNWLYKTYLNTQMNNIHSGIPSDCPHIERRGYTGDGQLTCHVCMDTMDAKKFYEKWIWDIGDCQDVKSGHVQYTAPYTRCGGGPGGWGSAIVEVPYRFYLHYGDLTPCDRLFPQMCRYLDYLDAHSVNCLVVSDKEGEWCLGDWCTPEPVMLPAAFVNNYFYVKSVEKMIEIARLTGRDGFIPSLEARMNLRKDAIMAAYYNTWDSNFLAGRQGANAYALDIGLGDEKTYENTVAYYEKIGYLDTGIFGTEILTRILFAHGDGDLAVRLMTSEHTFSFHEMMKRGSTTIWEYMPDATRDRSHDHPMFGACVAQLFDGILGIQETCPGGKEVVLSPCFVKNLNFAKGYRTLPEGKVAVSWERQEKGILLSVEVPEDICASLRLSEKEPIKITGKWSTVVPY